MNTGEIIKECREQRGLSLSDFAYKCDTSWSALKNLEKRADCRVSTLEGILHELDYEIDIMPIEKLRGEP